MTTIQFLAEWALRSSVLILSATLLLAILRVKDSWVRSAAWSAALCCSLALPVLRLVAPVTPAVALPSFARQMEPHQASVESEGVRSESIPAGPPQPAPRTGLASFDWALAAWIAYAAVVAVLLSRLAVGLWISARLVRASLPAQTAGASIRESDRVTAPVAIGLTHPVIVLPADWREWDAGKLDAVLAHERAHIERRDAAWQLMSALHRAVLWFSPLSWFLHQRIVRSAEEACDDAAVCLTGDRVKYAEALLDFTQHGIGKPIGWSLTMARYGRPDERIHRILDSARLSQGITRWRLGAVLALAAPLTLLVAQTRSQTAAPPPAPIPAQLAVAAQPRAAAAAQHQPARPAQTAKATASPEEVSALGSVQAVNTVRVTPRVEGQLLSVSFREGQMVHAGDQLASLDPAPYQPQVTEAQGQLERDMAHLSGLNNPGFSFPGGDRADIRAQIRIDQAKLEAANLQLNYTRVTAPISGIAGLRLIDAGNMIHPGETIVVITQLEPVSVVFPVAQSWLQPIRARISGGPALAVEAWTRDAARKIATGDLAAIDNMVDPETGTAKLKAVFENKDGALFPGQFVNVRLRLGGM